MKFGELVYSNENDLNRIYVYDSDEQWENDFPELVFNSVDGIRRDLLVFDVKAWYIDTNFCLHAYLF